MERTASGGETSYCKEKKRRRRRRRRRVGLDEGERHTRQLEGPFFFLSFFLLKKQREEEAAFVFLSVRSSAIIIS